ncbi:MAG: type II secretion system F family protein [Planctomycetes bacterium]|nr:type II secretion system F family protein [Planctomycetota bacterium]MBL7187298.1 type II secretion system F family protein [Phycisphaerae bacterium]
MPDALAIAYYNLSAMLDAGVPVLRSLNTVTPGMKPRMRKAFLALAEGVSQGNPLAETMVQYPRVFGPVDVMLVEVAEKSGNLPDLIGLLSKWHEISHRMFKKMLSGLMLPGLVLVIAAFVFPLPGFVLGGWDVNSYLQKVVGILGLFLVPAAVIVLIIRFTPKTGPLRRALDSLALRIPVLSRAMYRLALSRYCWSFHMLCKAGVPVTDCVEMSIAATGNLVVGDLFRPAVESVRAGGTMGERLSPRLPLELIEMWKVGEETGQLDDISKRLADTYTEQAEFWFGEFSRWFPRFVYLLISIMLIWMIFQIASSMWGTLGTPGTY